MKNSVSRTCLAFLLLAFIFTGCSPNVKQRGRVTFSDDGSPLSQGVVCFESEEMLARGTLQKDGTFRVGSTSASDGLPPGKYKVFFSDVEVKSGEGDESKSSLLVPSKYTNPETTDIEITVSKGDPPLEIKIDRVK